jgi:hypothetical protein
VISTAIRLARVGSGSELVAAVLLGLGFPCALLAALIPSFWGFVAAAVVTYATDWYLHRRGSYLVNRLNKIKFALPMRFLVRQLLLVLLLARLNLAEQTLFYVAVGGFLFLFGLQAPHGALATLIKLRRTMPVVTRNVDLHGLKIPDAPPRALLRRSAEKLLHLDIPAVAGVLIAARTHQNVFAYVGIGVAVGLAVLYTGALFRYIRRNRRVPTAPQVLKGVDRWLREYRPTVAMYFSGSKESAYQVKMWMETLEQLDARAVIILRERYIVPQLEATSVPVICVPGGIHLMNMDLSTVRVTLYPANVGKNIHMLRVPTMKHVFIGHGDSDKMASVNPFSKVYDEVWTAGRAGRDRYALADVGVRDEDIVEVGRPQLAPIASWTGAPKNPIPTILYAPTWEGWDDNPGNTSLLLAGENIVKRLLRAEQPVRLIYKPHPFTGTRSARAKAVHTRIMALVEKAAAERAAEPRWAKEAAAAQADQAAARATLARVEARLAELSKPGRPGGDESETSRVSLADLQRLEEIKKLRAEWNEAYWNSFGWWQHKTVTGTEPRLYDCFNEADGMVSDISSVVSDFIASGKPYAVTDSAEVGAEEFRRQNTAVRAAVVLSNGAEELGELLAAVADPAADTLAEARRELKRYLLGPDEPTSIEQFNAAVAALAARSEARNAGAGQQLVDLEGDLDDVGEDTVAGDTDTAVTGLDSPVAG